jgi:hypothetical protein
MENCLYTGQLVHLVSSDHLHVFNKKNEQALNGIGRKNYLGPRKQKSVEKRKRNSKIVVNCILFFCFFLLCAWMGFFMNATIKSNLPFALAKEKTQHFVYAVFYLLREQTCADSCPLCCQSARHVPAVSM